jgi:hypothetical protein
MCHVLFATLMSVPEDSLACFVLYLKLYSFESASELYRSSDRLRSAKLEPTLADRGCHVVSATSPSDRNFDFPDLELLLFHSSSSSNCSRG